MLGESVPTVSVIMPVFNGGSTLQLAVQSVLLQEFSDFELLVIDDGSSDGCIEMLSSLRDARLKIVRQKHGGLVAALNNGVRQSRGRYIARHDQDDVSFPQRFTKQVAFLEDNPKVDLLGTRAIVFVDSGEVVGLLPFKATHKALTSSLWFGIPLPHPTWMGRREWFLRNLYCVPEALRAEDQELLLRASFTSCYACLADVLVGYRQGSFKFVRTISTRLSVLKMQVKIFMSRGLWFDLLCCVGIIAIKVMLDVATAAMGSSKLWFVRMNLKANASDQIVLHELLSKSPSIP